MLLPEYFYIRKKFYETNFIKLLVTCLNGYGTVIFFCMMAKKQPKVYSLKNHILA